MITILALTAHGYKTAKRIQAVVGGTVYGTQGRIDTPHTFIKPTDFIAEQFTKGHTIIGICATAILVRAIGQYIEHKKSDPAVISVSENGHTVIPILGGHYGGYNLAHKIGEIFNTTPAITNAGNTQLGFSFDDLPDGWIVANPELIKPITAHMLGGGSVGLINETNAHIPFAQHFQHTTTNTPFTVHITPYNGHIDNSTLVIYVPCVVIGIGCERYIASKKLHTLIQHTLAEYNIHPHAIKHFASIDIKVDEPAIKSVCTAYNKPLQVYDTHTLAPVQVPNPSEIVYKQVGCYGVAEGAVIASNAHIFVEKIAQDGCTIALGLDINTNTPPQGRTNGVLYIVGIGAGDAQWRTPEAIYALKTADIVVGYQLYLDLIADIIHNKPTVYSTLGAEQQRCRTALDLASAGKTVALVCSGDASIYALATLVFELLDSHPENRHWQGVDIHIVCGISAFQACSSKVGALFSHDFCLLSLSDLLTPRDTIIKRLHAVGQGDFVVAFYNPQSQRRRTLLPKAKNILLQYRPATTPVIIGRNIGRVDENIVTTTLQDFDVSPVDMLTLIIIGNTQTKTFISAGRTFTYTPRGYAQKNK